MALTQLKTGAIADDAVTTDKLANAINTERTANTAKVSLGADSVTGAKIADDAIDSEHITDGSIDNAHLADDAVGVAELSATGTASSSTFLRGDNSWTAVNTDLVSDTSPQLGGALDTNGSNINFGDSTTNGTTVNRLTFGTATNGDLALWHDGNNSYVQDQGTGELRIRGAEVVKIQDTDSAEDMGVFNKNGSVELYHNNSKKFETTSTGATVTSHLLASGTGGVTLRAGSTNAGGAALYLDGDSDGDCSGSTFAHITHDGNGDLNIMSRNPDGDAEIIFGTNDYNAFRIDSNRHVRPESNNARDLGSSTYRWRNIYTNDLNLSNEGGANDVDGTWGNWTIQEGESDLFLKNNRSGKKYKFNLTEIL